MTPAEEQGLARLYEQHDKSIALWQRLTENCYSFRVIVDDQQYTITHRPGLEFRGWGIYHRGGMMVQTRRMLADSGYPTPIEALTELLAWSKP